MPWSAILHHIVQILAHRMAARMPETPPATAPAEATPATGRHRALASEILTKTKGKRKLFDKLQWRLRYLSGRIAETYGPAESTRSPAASQPHAVRTVADALPPIGSAAVPVDIDRVARVRRRTPGAAKTLQWTATAVRAALSQSVAKNLATTVRASGDRRGSAHFQAVAFCYRVLAGRY